MRKGICFLYIFMFCALLPTIAAEPITFQSAWEQPPQTWPAEGYEAAEAHYPGVKALYYAGPAYQGKPTRVFAYYALPALKPGKKVPGMVLVHGGGGTAFSEWVAMWRDRGYAAIAMDCNGSRPLVNENGVNPKEQHAPHEWGGPGGWGGFEQMDALLEDHWVYQSAAGIAMAHSLLRSFPEVDPDRIGLTGISWGGFLTCISAGLDDRYACAAPVYGCGGIVTNSAWQDVFAKMPPEHVTRWNESYDPLVYLPNAAMPILWVNGTNDFAYYMVNWQHSYKTSPAERTLCMRVNMPHSHRSGWAPKEIMAYMDHHLFGSNPLIQITDQGREGSAVWVSYSQAVPVKTAQLHYCEDLAPVAHERVWNSIDAEIDNPNCKANAILPETAQLYFFTLISPNDLLVSTEHQQIVR